VKTLGIIGAMHEEVELLISEIGMVSKKNIVGVDFHMGKMAGNNVVVVQCGVGKVNAAICTQVLVDLYAVDYIINIGVAGAVHNELNIGDVVISNELLYHDFDATHFGYPRGTIPRMETGIFKADDYLIDVSKKSSYEVLQDFESYIGRICSGDMFVASKEYKNKLWSEFKAYCTEMEGAAVAHTAYLNNVPFVVVRAISDTASDDASETYKNGLEIAVKNSAEIALKMIEAIVD